MAAAKRPLSLGELGEAISVEPCQSYFMPERMLNDPHGIVRWCHGLTAFDELEETLQFTHSSVKDFFCNPDTEQRTLPGFHFEPDEADRQLGEVCVTYLNFNDFKTQVIKAAKPEVDIDPMIMASQALTSQYPNWVLNQVRNLMTNRAKSPFMKPISINSRKDLVTNGYWLYDYASKHWLLHTTRFSPDHGRVWSLFQTLAENHFPVISEPPLAISLWSLDARVKALRNFMFAHEHQALFRQWVSRHGDRSRGPMTLSRILKWKCFSFINLLTPTADQAESPWLETVLSLKRYDLEQVLRGAGTEWIHVLTLTERSRLLARVIGTNHVESLSASATLVELGVDPYHEFKIQEKTTTILEELIRDSDSRLLRTVCGSMVATNADFERKIAPAGRTALHVAAVLRRYIAAGILLDHGAEVDATDDYGYTALHLAVKGEASTSNNSDVLDLVSQLLIAGAAQNVKDVQGRTALSYASHDFECRLREQLMKYRIFLD